MGQGSCDSAIDLLLHPCEPSDCETLCRVLCKLNISEINSHHDVIISLCKLPTQPEVASPMQNGVTAPRIDVDRPKVIWSTDGIAAYQDLVSRNIKDIRNNWYHPSSTALSSVMFKEQICCTTWLQPRQIRL